MPDVSQVRIDQQLTGFVRNYGYEKQRTVADTLAPAQKVTSETGTFKTLGDELLDIHVADFVADEAETNRIDYAVGSDTYIAIERSLKMLVTDRQIRQAPNKLAPMQRAAVHCMHGLKLRNDYRFVTVASATAVAGSQTTTPAADWSASTAYPTEDLGVAKNAFKVSSYGIEPTHFVMGDHIADEFAANRNVTALISAAAALSQPMQLLTTISGKRLPRFIMDMEVIVPSCRYNTAEPGATLSVSPVWGDDAYLFAVDASGDNSGYASQFQELGYTVVRWRSNDPAGWWVRVVRRVVAKETNTRCVHKIIDVT